MIGTSVGIDSNLDEEMRIFSYIPSLPGLAAEHHCILFVSGVPVYALGTYGSTGYFEGAFNNDHVTVAVAFYEVSYSWAHSSDPPLVSAPVIPRSGFASWTYSNNFTELHGSFFGSASSDLLGSSGDWSASGGISQKATSSALSHRCLLAKPDSAAFRDLLLPSHPNSSLRSSLPGPASGDFRGAAGAVTFCPDGARGVRGNYSYTYVTADPARSIPKGAREAGALAPGAIPFAAAGGYGVAGAWLASSGPRAGRPVTGLYMARPAAGLLGYTCDSAAGGGGGGGGGAWPSGCRFDRYGEAAAAICPPAADYSYCPGGD